MAKGKPWTVEDERKLQQLLTENKSIRSISKILGKTREAVRMKIARLGVVVDRGEKCTRSTTTTAKMSLPDELPSIEEELKVLVAALKGLETEGHKSLNNTMLYTQLISFKDDDFAATVAHSEEEACKLIEAGFEYVCDFG